MDGGYSGYFMGINQVGFRIKKRLLLYVSIKFTLLRKHPYDGINYWDVLNNWHEMTEFYVLRYYKVLWRKS